MHTVHTVLYEKLVTLSKGRACEFICPVGLDSNSTLIILSYRCLTTTYWRMPTIARQVVAPLDDERYPDKLQ